MLLCIGLLQPVDAQALALGRLVVQSALGEPLRAEIDVPDISADEAATLRVGLASAEVFRAAGIDPSAALADLQISLQRRPDGRAYLRLRGPRPVMEPFVDVIVEANWAAGRVVREYTLLFDPPVLRAAAPVAAVPATAAQATAPAVLPPVAPARLAPPVAAPARAVPPVPATQVAPRQVRVQTGDTAGRIAAAHLPAAVSLDQMLVAMLRTNPQAFIGGNVNRIKAGAVLDLPDAEQASAVPAPQARQIIVAQSRDFAEFRHRLAAAAPAAAPAQDEREAVGRVQAQIQDQRAAAPVQDKLVLSRPEPPSPANQEAAIAQQRQQQQAAAREAEVQRNIEQLAQLAARAAVPAQPAPLAPPAAEQLAAVPAVEPPAALAGPAAPEPAPAPQPEPLPAPTVEATLPAPVPAPAAPNLMEQLRHNPLMLPAAAALLALLAGLGLYRLRRRKSKSEADSSFLGSQLQHDSFFGASGGQRIDTAQTGTAGSSMVYSPSQLDAAGDVDPVAEADVYLAYGRDLQAEEILKEAMRSAPTRVAIHHKLLEIYAKRRDVKAFEVVASELFGLTQGQGVEWASACELGRELDPANPLYQPGGGPAVKATAAAAAPVGAMNTVPFAASQPAEIGNRDAQSAPAELDLDLDFDSELTPLQQRLAPAAQADAVISGLDDLSQTEELTRSVEREPAPGPLTIDFELDFPVDPVQIDTIAATEGKAAFDPRLPARSEPIIEPDFDFDAPAAAEPSRVAEPSVRLDDQSAGAVAAPLDFPAFDLNQITLDLDGPQASLAQPDECSDEENPLDTKLSLAQEFRAIGDFEGARSLAEEVLAEASGAMQSKARVFLAELS
ncbi:FimV/HubP family polar landmark protein [Hydrogenophaga sp.]|uniref:FimV/HubP family polar landmark protein n=1 Tax=Hydrogenophaga sp. TaxID=1904254 RepID=UPI0025C3CC31|nr:FimV/HubP family polar landmark protein [Hydrogenophaga sp.]